MFQKKTTLVIFFSLAMAAKAFAHGGFVGSLSSHATLSRTDILIGRCPTGTAPTVTTVQASVKDLFPVYAPVVNVVVRKVSGSACSSSVLASGVLRSDSTDGNGTYSAPSSVAAANGNYFRIEVSKNAGPAERYELDYHCENGTANHPVPTLTYCQNQ